MPNYRVYVHETDIYRFDVAAGSEPEARRKAELLLSDVSIDSWHRDVETGEVQPLPDDAEVLPDDMLTADSLQELAAEFPA